MQIQTTQTALEYLWKNVEVSLLYFISLAIYEGFWKDGKMNGCGRTIFPDGSYYIGDFKDDNWCKGGIKYNKDGTIKWEVTSDKNKYIE